MDGNFKPMEPVSWPAPFDDPAFVHQVKWDGIRILARVEPGGVTLRTRYGRDRTDNYPELQELGGLLRGTDALLDGEAVVLDDAGRPSFGRILRRDRSRAANAALRRALPVYYVAFDVLFLNGEPLLGRSFSERQEILADVLQHGEQVTVCRSHAEGVELFAATGRLGLEGIISKELAGRYHPGRKHPTWRKVKHFRRLNAVAGGVFLKQGRANALLLGLYDERGLIYVGRAASGLSAADLVSLTALARAHETFRSPFVEPPTAGRGLKVVWLAVQPTVVVRYNGWTDQGRLRNPVIEGFSTVPAAECVFP
jgi:bifunctional non-homologous end joining protein LigD